MKLLKSETVRYLIAGGLTVLVNIASYCCLEQIIPQLLANLLAFLCATIFAFWANSRFVFFSPCEWKRFLEFMTMRIGTMIIDSVGMWYFLSLNWDDIVAKIIMNVVVIVLNYLFSKLIIFKKQ